MRRIVFIAASLLVSGIFLWLALDDVPLADVWASIRQANPLWVLVSMAGVFGALASRAVRWRGLVGFKIPLLKAFYMVNVTFLLNQLPLRAGEVARSLLATSAGVPVVTAATSILVERLLDTVLVVVMLSFALSRSPNTPQTASQAAALFGIASVLAFVVLVILARYPQFAHRLLNWLEARLHLLQRVGVRRLFDHMLDGLHPLTNLRSAVFAIGWTLIAWTFSLATFIALEMAVNLQGADLIIGSMLGVGLVAFSIAIPFSVAAIGPFQAAVRVAGEALALPLIVSTSLGFIFHGVTVVSYGIWGTIGLLALGVSLSELLQSGDKQADRRDE